MCVHVFCGVKPSGDDDPLAPMITWKDFQRLMPWEIVILVGGGYALAAGCKVCMCLGVLCSTATSCWGLRTIFIFFICGNSSISVNTADFLFDGGWICFHLFTQPWFTWLEVKAAEVQVDVFAAGGRKALSGCSRGLSLSVWVCVCVGVRSVSVDRQTAGAHEWSSSLGRHPVSLPAGVSGHRVRLQPSNSHRLPAHPVSTGTTHAPLHTYTKKKLHWQKIWLVC